jgi:hypothetical protein
MANILKELKGWCIVFNNNEDTTWDDISEVQAEEINNFMKEDGFKEEEIMKAWDEFSKERNRVA